MTDNFIKQKVVFVNVKIIVKPDADIQEIISECDYEFIHDDIVETEIVDFNG
jgi:hypothetical protein